MSAATRRGVYIGLGANLDDPVRQVEAAIAALDGLPTTRVLRRSALYRTAPWGRVDQPDFVNAVVELETALEPEALVGSLLAIEREAGRERGGDRWGPRRIDLDLLLDGVRRLDAPSLTLPHPRLAERAFVLVPLAELAFGLEVPGRGRVGELLGRLRDAELGTVVRLPA